MSRTEKRPGGADVPGNRLVLSLLSNTSLPAQPRARVTACARVGCVECAQEMSGDAWCMCGRGCRQTVEVEGNAARRHIVLIRKVPPYNGLGLLGKRLPPRPNVSRFSCRKDIAQQHRRQIRICHGMSVATKAL
eukprot:3562581-Rhodomonas_salina.4